jgi:hypothetical protein
MKCVILIALAFALALAFAAGPEVALTTQPDQLGLCGNGVACP